MRRRATTAFLAVACCAAGAGTAVATSVSVNDRGQVVVAGDSSGETLSVTHGQSTAVEIHATSSVATGPGCVHTHGMPSVVSCPVTPTRERPMLVMDLLDGRDVLNVNPVLPANWTEWLVKGGAGNDDLTGSGAASIEGGAGDDILRVSTSGPSDVVPTLDGGDGSDTLASTPGNRPQRMLGGPGNDVLIGDGGDDLLDGGDGDDELVGDSRTGSCVGCAANDTLEGGPGHDELAGGPGSDVLTDVAGTDEFAGEADDDRIVSRDGVADTVDCGGGFDTVVLDLADTFANCETRQFPDNDGDGAGADEDCDEADAAVHPRAQEVPENGKDDDCRNGDAVNFDRDGDSVARAPMGLDCDDNDPAVRPGAREIPGNGVDDDCDGDNAKLVLVQATVSRDHTVYLRYTRLTRLAVIEFEPGIVVDVTCRGKRKGCPRGLRRTFGNAGPKLDYTRSFRRARLRPGAVVEVRISKPERIAKVVRITIRDRRKPRRQSLCLPPGAKRPQVCA